MERFDKIIRKLGTICTTRTRGKMPAAEFRQPCPAVWLPPHLFHAVPRETPSLLANCDIRNLQEPGLSQGGRLYRAIGDRLIWWPGGAPSLPTVAIVSSRLGRSLEDHAPWFRALVTAVAETQQMGHATLVAIGTTTARFVLRAAERAGVTSVVIHSPNRSCMAVDAWIAALRRAACHSDSLPGHTISGWVSPRLTELSLPPDVATDERWDESLPLADRLAFGGADRIEVLAVRPRGSMERLIQLVRDEPPASRPTVREVQADIDVSSLKSSGRHRFADRDFRYPTCRELEGDFLTHCTRRTIGPWPDQSEADFIDDLLLGRPAADHSPLATLRRIILERRLRAVQRMNRAATPVVSFTEVPLVNLFQRRTFRSHRGGWDFEPYAIAIRRSQLEKRGARAVIYGDDAVWESLPPCARPFFQPTSSIPTSGCAMDWQGEREWRHLGDVVLDDFRECDLAIIVPRVAEAELIERFAPWPIYLAESG